MGKMSSFSASLLHDIRNLRPDFIYEKKSGLFVNPLEARYLKIPLTLDDKNGKSYN